MVSLLMRRFVWFGVLDGLATAATIFKAYHAKGQFYPTCVYLQTSNLSFAIIVSFVLYLCVAAAIGIMRFAFGDLRVIERDHLREYSFMTITEMCLAMTVFKTNGGFDVNLIFGLLSLLALKAFHWITRDRVDYIEQAPTPLPRSYHVRLVMIIGSLWMMDVFLMSKMLASLLKEGIRSGAGASVTLYYTSEYSLVCIKLLSIAVRFGLNYYETKKIEETGNGWDAKSGIVYYVDFAIDTLKLGVHFAFFILVSVMYGGGIPLHIFRDLLTTSHSFVTRIRDLFRYLRATRDLQKRFEQVPPDQLAGVVCVVCREELSTEGRKLPCGHIFHFKCLRSWLERQQACPTCRASVTPKPATSPRPAATPAHAQQPQLLRAQSPPARAASQVGANGRIPSLPLGTLEMSENGPMFRTSTGETIPLEEVQLLGDRHENNLKRLQRIFGETTQLSDEEQLEELRVLRTRVQCAIERVKSRTLSRIASAAALPQVSRSQSESSINASQSNDDDYGEMKALLDQNYTPPV